MPTRVLVVEDEASIRELLAEYLRGRGLEVAVVGDAETALALLGSDPPDVIVTDLRLPGLDGVEVVRAAAAHQPALPVLTMTGFATVESAVAALTAGASDYLLKPFRLREIFAAIDRAVRGGEQARAARWAQAAVGLLSAAEEARTSAQAEDLVERLATLLGDMPGVERVELVEADGQAGVPLGAGRRILVRPPLPAAHPYVAAVHRALERVGP